MLFRVSGTPNIFHNVKLRTYCFGRHNDYDLTENKHGLCNRDHNTDSFAKRQPLAKRQPFTTAM